MAPEEPKVRIHVEFGTDHALAVFPARFGNLADAVEHQHRRQRQLCVAWAKHLTAAARQQILVFVTAAPIQHLLTLSQNPDGAFSSEMDPFRLGSAPVIMDWHKYHSSELPCGNWRSPLPKSQSPRALYHTAPRTAKHLGMVNHSARARPGP